LNGKILKNQLREQGGDVTLVDDTNANSLVLHTDPKGNLFLWVDTCSHCDDVCITILDDFSLVMTFEVHILNHIIECVLEAIHCEVKNDAEVEFRFEDLPAFSVEENTAFDVAEVGIARC
jgi:hypothetical protein